MKHGDKAKFSIVLGSPATTRTKNRRMLPVRHGCALTLSEALQLRSCVPCLTHYVTSLLTSPHPLRHLTPKQRLRKNERATPCTTPRPMTGI